MLYTYVYSEMSTTKFFTLASYDEDNEVSYIILSVQHYTNILAAS